MEGLRPIPSAQPENKNSPRQLESEAGLSHGIPRPVSGRGGPPSIGEPCWTTTMCCLRTASLRLSQAGFSQINVTPRRRSTSSTGASREPQTLSRELRALGNRKLSARPCHHSQAEGAIEDFKKTSRPSGRDRAREKKVDPGAIESGSPTRRESARRTRSHGAAPDAFGVQRRLAPSPPKSRTSEKARRAGSRRSLWCSTRAGTVTLRSQAKSSSFWIFLLLVCHQRKALSRRRKSAPTGFVSKHAVLRLVRLVVWQSE